MYITRPQADLLTDEVKKYIAGVEGALGLLGHYGIALPSSNELSRRKTDLERLVALLARMGDPFRAPDLTPDELALLLLTAEWAAAQQEQEIAKLGQLSSHPEMTTLPRARFDRLTSIREWQVFRAITPALHVGLRTYLAARGKSLPLPKRAEPARLLRCSSVKYGEYSPSSRLAAGPAAPISARSDFRHGLLDDTAIDKLDAEHRRILQDFGGADVHGAEQTLSAPTPNWRTQVAQLVDEYMQQHGTSTRKLQRQLGNVRDKKLRMILRRDALEAVRLLCTDSFKAAFILAGTVVEGVLRELLDNNHHKSVVDTAFRKAFPNAKSVPSLDIYHLHQLIDVNAELNTIEKTHARFLHGVRDLRNFVHAHAESKQKVRVNRHVATVAVAAMFELIGLF